MLTPIFGTRKERSIFRIRMAVLPMKTETYITNGWAEEERMLEYFIPYISNKRGGFGRKEGKKV